MKKYLKTPLLSHGNCSSWAQYSLLAKNEEQRNNLVNYLNAKDIPTAVFYKQIFSDMELYNESYQNDYFSISSNVSKRIFSIPINAYLKIKY